MTHLHHVSAAPPTHPARVPVELTTRSADQQRILVLLERDLRPADVERIRTTIAGRGLESWLAADHEGAVLGLRHDSTPASLRSLRAIAGVRRVVPVTTPHPLVSSLDETASEVNVGAASIGPKTFTLIAGPCAIETAEQSGAACDAAAAAGATVLRGDLFKHRTSPYSFQGLGRAGLELLAENRGRLGLPVVVEVLSPEQLESVIEVVDIVRIGARNMQNRDLLLACGRVGKPVMLKRGLTATIEEWLLAAETVASCGNLDIILCERGIRTFEPSTRNTLDLSAIGIVRERCQLPIIVDPSHGSGLRHLVPSLALAAVAAGADGVMIEVHPQPDKALCDGPQAMLPHELAQLGTRLAKLARFMGRSVVSPLGAAADRGDRRTG
jgi:3-deoxy-7-phosphoheptulonate synthase